MGLIQERVEQLRPELYRQLALHLQVLRKGLLHQVQQACFHLATQVHPERYGQMSAAERTELHRRLGALVNRCGCLLTVEQLCGLGQQMQREQRLRRQGQQASILSALQAADGAAHGDQPEGSVQLGMDLPLSAELFSEGFSGLVGLGGLGTPDSRSRSAERSAPLTTGLEGLFPPGSMAGGIEPEMGMETDAGGDAPDDGHEAAGGNGTSSGEDGHIEPLDLPPPELEDSAPEGPDGEVIDGASVDGELSEDEEADGGAWDHGAGIWGDSAASDRTGQPRSGSDRNPELKLLQSMFSLAAETLGRLPQEEPADFDRPGDGDRGHGHDQRDDPPLLPTDPLQLLAWWQALDQALQRRLRNLSHGLNVELLRLRLTRSLMPVNLLEAVLDGQIDPQPAPANLLRLQLPFAAATGGMQLETLGLLLRCGDLEFAMPPLRTCRKRLEHQRQELRKMAQQYRHWQRRLQALEAEQQWLQDDGQVNPPPL